MTHDGLYLLSLPIVDFEARTRRSTEATILRLDQTVLILRSGFMKARLVTPQIVSSTSHHDSLRARHSDYSIKTVLALVLRVRGHRRHLNIHLFVSSIERCKLNSGGDGCLSRILVDIDLSPTQCISLLDLARITDLSIILVLLLE